MGLGNLTEDLPLTLLHKRAGGEVSWWQGVRDW